MVIKMLRTKNFSDYVDKFINKYVPERYNQVQLLYELPNKEIDHYISISNRADGKSFNYIHFFIRFAIDYGVGFTLVSRHFTVRKSYQQLIKKIAEKSPDLNERDFVFFRDDFYITVVYKNKKIAIITDLNEATDLKYHSAYVSSFPIIVYDEFLALEDDYLPDEWEKLKTIYSSINREPDIDVIGFPKMFYLGNAVNFSSPVLASLNLYNRLENHPINTVQQYSNILMEMRKNINANEERNLRAFNEQRDPMTEGQFEINNYEIATSDDHKQLAKASKEIYIKLKKNYMRITYNEDLSMIILAIVGYATNYSFNMELKDNRENSVYLKDSFFSEKHAKKYLKNIYKFENSFSKDFILNGMLNLTMLKLEKIISVYEGEIVSDKDWIEKRYHENYIEKTKRYILGKFFR